MATRIAAQGKSIVSSARAMPMLQRRAASTPMLQRRRQGDGAASPTISRPLSTVTFHPSPITSTSYTASITSTIKATRTTSPVLRSSTSGGAIQWPSRRGFTSSSLQRETVDPSAGSPATASSPTQGADPRAPPEHLTEGENEIWKRLQSLEPAALMVQDVSGGCGTMYAIEIASPQFKGKSMVLQHRLVNSALKGLVETWHGVQLRTMVP